MDTSDVDREIRLLEHRMRESARSMCNEFEDDYFERATEHVKELLSLEVSWRCRKNIVEQNKERIYREESEKCINSVKLEQS